MKLIKNLKLSTRLHISLSFFIIFFFLILGVFLRANQEKTMVKIVDKEMNLHLAQLLNVVEANTGKQLKEVRDLPAELEVFFKTKLENIQLVDSSFLSPDSLITYIELQELIGKDSVQLTELQKLREIF